MNTEIENRTKLVAPCGLDCGICELYQSKDNPQIMEHLISLGVPEEKLPCTGCRSTEGQCPMMQDSCATYVCASQKTVNTCNQCAEFPCSMLQPAADRAQSLAHNLKIFNLCQIDKIGMEEFIKNSNCNKTRYFMGKMILGEGPVVPNFYS